MTFQAVFALTAATVAVVMDLTMGKVKNWWILVLWCVAFVYRVMTGGSGGAVRFVAGGVLPLLILFPLFCLRMLGPGDIKLFSALGSMMGVGAICTCMVISFICGGVLAVGIFFIHGNFISRLRYFTDYIHDSICNRKINPYYVTGSRPENLHFTVAILMGVIMYGGGFY